jgi:hypothetical protein
MKVNKEVFSVSRDLLLLVGKRLSRRTWQTWTEEMREVATDWAAAIYLSASDNRVLKKSLVKPDHVEKLPDRTPFLSVPIERDYSGRWVNPKLVPCPPRGER